MTTTQTRRVDLAAHVGSPIRLYYKGERVGTASDGSSLIHIRRIASEDKPRPQGDWGPEAA